MWQSLGRRYVMAIGIVLSVAVSAAAQTVTRGQVTDEWDNGLEGVTVLAEPTDAGASQTTTTDEDGRFQFLGLSSARWSITATLNGYQGLRQVVPDQTEQQPAGGLRAAVAVDGQRLP